MLRSCACFLVVALLVVSANAADPPPSPRDAKATDGSPDVSVGPSPAAPATSVTMADITGHEERAADIEAILVRRLMTRAWQHYMQQGNDDAAYANLYNTFMQELKQAKRRPECTIELDQMKYMVPPPPTRRAREARLYESFLLDEKASRRARTTASGRGSQRMRSTRAKSLAAARDEQVERQREERAKYLSKRMRREGPSRP